MLRIALLLACVALAFANNNTNSSLSATPTPTPTSSLSNKTSSSTPVITPTTTAHSNSSNATSSSVYSSSIFPSSASSTVMPSSSINATTNPPTTTPKPTPTTPTTPPPPTFGDFSIKKGKKYCLLAQLSATFNVTYKQNATINTTKEAHAMVHIPFNASEFDITQSKCAVNGAATLMITWPKKEKFYTFEMVFEATAAVAAIEKGKNYTGWDVKQVAFTVNTAKNPSFVNATEGVIKVVTNGSEFTLSGKYDSYYQCSPQKEYAFNDNVKVDITHVKLQPFMKPSVNETYSNSGELNDCVPVKPTIKPDNDGDIVPIAVGCALAGLVLIVLIAYIIGRRKSQRGYEKV